MSQGHRADPWALLATLAPALLLTLFLVALGGTWFATLDPAAQQAFAEQFAERLALVFMLLFVSALALGSLTRWLYLRWVQAPARLADLAAAAVVDGSPTLPLQRLSSQPGGGRAQQALAAVIDQLVQQRGELHQAIDDKVREASRGVLQEKARLAALMAELQQSVVVCNLDGRILLYNRRARLQFRALSNLQQTTGAPALASGDELMGIGRSIHAVLDRQLIAHALQGLLQRLQRGVTHPSTQFVTHTRGGQLLRVNLAAVRDVALEGRVADDSTPLAGYVLTIENITTEFADDAERDRALFAFTEAARASLGSLQAAVELLDEPAMDADTRARLQAVVREETTAMSGRIQQLADSSARNSRTRWPLEDMQGADLLAAVQRRLQALPALGSVEVLAEDVDPAVWLRVDSFSLLRVLDHLALRLHEVVAPPRLRLALRAAVAPGASTAATSPASLDTVPPATAPITTPDGAQLLAPHGLPQARPGLAAASSTAASGGRVWLDLAWPGDSLPTELAQAVQHEPLRVGQSTDALSIHDVVQRHGGAFWLAQDATRGECLFRLLLPREGARPSPAGLALAVAGNSASGPGEPSGAVPRAAGAEAAPVAQGQLGQVGVSADSRPEFYDFDLFAQRSPGLAQAALEDMPLAALSFTVFDTETTGLSPGDGDEILQIGATRIVAGKLRRQECFETLVDPQRSIPEAGMAIHGIRPEMVAGQPTIAAALRGLHAFAEDTVLVAHNAAFDMRFLQLKEVATGVRFTQPVLDTLLLSAVAQPQQASHGLEDIATRLGVSVLGRHTALGDAMVTAEVFLKLVPLLELRGIYTLGQALAAARQTFYARLNY